MFFGGAAFGRSRVRNTMLYDLLDVEHDASYREIKDSFRQLEQKHHPDRVGGDKETFKELLDAYEVLSDEVTREKYDSQADDYYGVEPCQHESSTKHQIEEM